PDRIVGLLKTTIVGSLSDIYTLGKLHLCATVWKRAYLPPVNLTTCRLERPETKANLVYTLHIGKRRLVSSPCELFGCYGAKRYPGATNRATVSINASNPK